MPKNELYNGQIVVLFNILILLSFLKSTLYFDYIGLFTISTLCLAFFHLQVWCAIHNWIQCPCTDSSSWYQVPSPLPSQPNSCSSSRFQLFGEAPPSTSSMNFSPIFVITSDIILMYIMLSCVHVSIES